MPDEDRLDGHEFDAVIDEVCVRDIIKQGAKGIAFIALMYEPGEMKMCAVCRPLFASDEEADTFQMRCEMYYLSRKRN